MKDEFLVISALVRKLGREVKLTVEDYEAAKDSELLRMEDPTAFGSWINLRVRQKAVTLEGEIMDEEPRPIEA